MLTSYRVDMAHEYGSELSTREKGEAVRQQLLELYEEHGDLSLDMANVDLVTPSFADEAIGLLAIQIGVGDFQDHFEFQNLNSEYRSLLNMVITNRVEKTA